MDIDPKSDALSSCATGAPIWDKHHVLRHQQGQYRFSNISFWVLIGCWLVEFPLQFALKWDWDAEFSFLFINLT